MTVLVKCEDGQSYTIDDVVSINKILEVINTYFPNFLQDWEIQLIINDCLKQNAQSDNDILQIIDDYLTGIENSV